MKIDDFRELDQLVLKMRKRHINNQFAIPPETAIQPELRGWTPEQVGRYVRYQLSELAGANAHHEFEQLCFQLALKRIYPNIVPSTGPVSAGGDQGSDFETFEVGAGGSSGYFAKAATQKVVFACSIEKNYKKKIKEDLASVANAEPYVAKVKFFSNSHIAKGIRYRLQEYARGAHGIELEIFDSYAISSLLADPEVFWIAERFLGMPSDIFLAPVAAEECSWYQDAKDLTIDEHQLRAADFFVLKRAVRYATGDPSLHSDLLPLIKKLRLFQFSQIPGLARRAFYEEFVASLRGLEFVKDCESRLPGYLGVVPDLAEASDIEDAAVLIHYLVGAQKRGLLELPLARILEWRKLLIERIDVLLRKAVSAGRRCSLTDLKAFLTLLDWVEQVAVDQQADVRALAAKSAERAFVIWRKMLKHVRSAPLFPLDAFAKRLAALAVEYGNGGEYQGLSDDTDKLLAARAGQQRVGEQAFERAKSYHGAGRLMEAIDQLHIAHVSSFTRETAMDTVYIPLFLAKLYAEANLFAAAKYYALASSFAALKIQGDELRSHVYRGLAQAASSDHANGASLGFFLTLKTTVLVASHFSASGAEKIQDFEWGRLYFYALILAYGASLVSVQLENYLVQDILGIVGLKEIYEEALPDTEEFYRPYATYDHLAAKAMSEGVAPPFTDVGSIRKLSWQQLGISWKVQWENTYETTAVVEGFAALLQILLADLRKTELSLFPSTVDLTIGLHRGKLRVKEVPSNEQVIREILLPDASLTPELVFGVAAMVLKIVSAYPHDRFNALIEQRMKLGLPRKTNPHAPYEVLFREFYSEEDYKMLHEITLGSDLKIPDFTIKTHRDLSGPSGTHKDYDPKRSREEIENRYRNSGRLLKYTLPRLLRDKSFVSTVAELRNDGWKDWHVLLAAGGVRLNFVVNEILPRNASPEEHKRVFMEVLNRDEVESDPMPPTERFTADELRFSLRLSQISTLKGMGLDCWQQTPVTQAIDTFLRRFNYWTDDVPHQDPFSYVAGTGTA